MLTGRLGSSLSFLPVSALCCHQIWSSLPLSACICKATRTKAPIPLCKGKGVSRYSDGLDLISPFRSLARPSLPSALLSLTLAPSGLSLSYFLRPHPITAPLDPTHPLPHPRFLAGRFVFIGTSHCSFVYFLFIYVRTCVFNMCLLNNTSWQCSVLVSFCLTSFITSFCFLTRTCSVGCLILVSNLWLWDLLNRAGHGRYMLV